MPVHSSTFGEDIALLCRHISNQGPQENQAWLSGRLEGPQTPIVSDRTFLPKDPCTSIVQKIFRHIIDNDENYLPAPGFPISDKLVRHWKGFSKYWKVMDFISYQYYSGRIERQNAGFKNFSVGCASAAIAAIILLFIVLAPTMLLCLLCKHDYVALIGMGAFMLSVDLVFITFAIANCIDACRGATVDLEKRYITAMRGFIKKFLDIMADIDQNPNRRSEKVYDLGWFHAHFYDPIDRRLPSIDACYQSWSKQFILPRYYSHSGLSERQLFNRAANLWKRIEPRYRLNENRHLVVIEPEVRVEVPVEVINEERRQVPPHPLDALFCGSRKSGRGA